MGKKLIPFTTRRDISYSFKVLEVDEPNAMAVMGGFVYINRGLLKMINGNPDELAFVLGHEMAHVSEKHMVKNLEKNLSGGLILQLVFGKSPELTQQLIAVAWNLTQLGYSREEEFQADNRGVDYMIKAGFNPRGAVSLMEKMKKAGGGEGIEFLMSHPIMDKRIERIKNDYPDYFKAGGA